MYFRQVGREDTTGVRMYQRFPLGLTHVVNCVVRSLSLLLSDLNDLLCSSPTFSLVGFPYGLVLSILDETESHITVRTIPLA